MNLSLRHAFLLAALALTAGCASSTPEYRYYTLDMQPRANLANAPAQLVTVRIEVNEALQHPEIMIRTSPTRIEYYALDRWAAGLQEQIAEKLKIEFANPAPGAPRLNLNARLMNCEQVDTPEGPKVEVKLEVHAEDFQKLYTRSEPASSASAAAAVEALSRATEAIATELAADLRGVVTAPDKH